MIFEALFEDAMHSKVFGVPKKYDLDFLGVPIPGSRSNHSKIFVEIDKVYPGNPPILFPAAIPTAALSATVPTTAATAGIGKPTCCCPK